MSGTRTALVTTVHRRYAHLERQHRALLRSFVPPDDVIIVTMNDNAPLHDYIAPDLVSEVLSVEGPGGFLPLAAARNLGAFAALDRGADVLIFLDVDCMPGRDLIGAYRDAALAFDMASRLLCGPVTYLDPPPAEGYEVDQLDVFDSPHPARPAPQAEEIIVGGSPDLFWSLSFAVSAVTWNAIGGFCEKYVGYGGEDTDFAYQAASRGINLAWIGSARAYHQYHPTTSPPVEHVQDIVRNSHIFYERWGFWPMKGWLDEFEKMGHVRHHSGNKEWYELCESSPTRSSIQKHGHE